MDDLVRKHDVSLRIAKYAEDHGTEYPYWLMHVISEVPVFNPNAKRQKDKEIKIPPRYVSGVHGKKYDRYYCGVCGFTLSEITWKYCPNCGQRSTDVYLGKRKLEP